MWLRDNLQRLVGQVLALVLASTAVAALLVTVVVPRVTGGVALTVLTGSMEPAYPVGSVVVVRPVEASDVATGDVITFAHASGSLTTHRVTEIDSTAHGLSFTTKGDANAGVDTDPVPAEAVRGRVWFRVPYLGHMRDAVGTPVGLGIVLGLAGLGLAWEPASSLVRRRVPRRQWLAAAGPESPADTIENAPQIADDQSPAPPPAGPLSDVAALSAHAALPDPVQLTGVRVELRPAARVEQQFLLAHLNAGVFERGNVLEILGLVHGQVVAFGPRHMVISVSGSTEHLDGVERLLRPFGLVEAQRSQVIHVGGEPASGTNADEPGEAGPSPVENFGALVLGPPPPPNVAFMCAPANGKSRERASQ